MSISVATCHAHPRCHFPNRVDAESSALRARVWERKVVKNCITILSHCVWHSSRSHPLTSLSAIAQSTLPFFLTSPFPPHAYIFVSSSGLAVRATSVEGEPQPWEPHSVGEPVHHQEVPDAAAGRQRSCVRGGVQTPSQREAAHRPPHATGHTGKCLHVEVTCTSTLHIQMRYTMSGFYLQLAQRQCL